jgi:hypothetical protein
MVLLGIEGLSRAGEVIGLRKSQVVRSIRIADSTPHVQVPAFNLSFFCHYIPYGPGVDPGLGSRTRGG